MKVRDLIAGSRFTPGAGRESERAPRVTVLLPTFRRGDSGLLGRTIESVLNQSYDDFELIIIDDASTDSSARVIAAAMRKDPRVSVIRHEHNIGLPAVSEYEGYLLARGDLISFAFDDTVLYRHGLRRLVRESERHPEALVTGYVKAYFRTPSGDIFSQPLGLGVDEEDLLSRNVIPNNAVLAPKALLEEVGLYDPHISVARLCDYDLWLRARRRFPIRFIATCIGEEHGPSTYDSLGHTYAMDDWATDDRMRQSRDELLRPDRFGDLDVFEVSSFPSARSRRVVGDLAARHLSTRPWMTAPAQPASPAERVPRILVLAAGIGASTQLYFEGLREVPGLHVRIIDPRFRTFTQLAEADIVIVSRHLGHNVEWVSAARACGIPVFYFLDDNLPLMAARKELDKDLTAEFSVDRLRLETKELAGVLTSTERLAASFRSQKLHSSVGVIDLVAPSVVAGWPEGPPRSPGGGAVTVALFVGGHRLREVRRILWPALVRYATESGEPVRLLVPEAALAGLKRLPGRDVVELAGFPTSSDYFVALRTLAEHGTDVLLVPRTRTVNAEFKALHPVLSAAAIGASLIVPAAEPYLELDGILGVTFVGAAGSGSDWDDALRAVLPGRTAVPASVLRGRFAPPVAATHLVDAIGEKVGATEPDERARLRVISDWLTTQVALTRASFSGAAAPPSEGMVALASQWQSTLRASRQLHAFRGRSRRLPGFRFPLPGDGASVPTGDMVELSPPLTGAAYVSYRMPLDAGEYVRLHLMVWGDGAAGDVVGVEIVDPEGRIALHTVAPLPREDEPVAVALDARRLRIETAGLHEVRVFARTRQLAFVLEHVDRGRFGLRRPRVTPLVRFERRSGA